MPAFRGFLKNSHKAGDPARGVPGAGDANTIANILQDIQGIGCRIEKPMGRGGMGWHVVVDGSTDISLGDYGSPVTQRAMVRTLTTSKGGAGSASGNFAASFTKNLETNTAILEGTSNGVLVKEGFSGIYQVEMNIRGSVYLNDVGLGRMTVLCTVGASQVQPTWELLRNLDASAHEVTFPTYTFAPATGTGVTFGGSLTQTDPGSVGISETTTVENTASASVFVDASLADVLISADWNTAADNGTSTAQINAFTVTLSQLVNSGT